MADKTGIEWTDATWTVVQGCDYESPGCKHCYVPAVLWRLMHNPNPEIAGPLAGLIEKRGDTLVFTGKVAMREDRLNWPLYWSKPRRIFVPSHGDIFHPAVTDHFLDKIFAVMALCPQHTFQVLTKRAGRMRAYLAAAGRFEAIQAAIERLRLGEWGEGDTEDASDAWPLPNVWLGTSVEDQSRADERIPLLLDTPAAKRFLSCEPMLGPVDLTKLHPGGAQTLDALAGVSVDPPYFDWPGIDWVIVGGESGKDARPMHPDWARSLRDQCKAASVPFFFKQWGEWGFDPRTISAKGRSFHHFEDGTIVQNYGKKAAGRLLDGREHNDIPTP